MKASKYLTPAWYSDAIRLAFCGPLAVRSSISMPNCGLKTASNSFLSSARAGIPTTILPSFFASCRVLSHSLFQSDCARRSPTEPQRNDAVRADQMKRYLFRKNIGMCFLLLLDACCRKYFLCHGRGEVADELPGCFRSGPRRYDGGGVSCVVLDFWRQRPDECESFVFALEDDGGGTESDFVTSAFTNVIEHGCGIRVAHGLGFQVFRDSQALE